MMKARVITTILLLMLVFSFTACGVNSDDKQVSAKTSDKQKNENDVKDETENTDNVDNKQSQKGMEMTQQEQQIPSQETSPETAMIKVYYSNADATAFENSEVEISSLSPEAVLEALVSKGALTADVKDNFFEITTVDEKQSIELDLNNAFASYVSNMGSTGEYYVVGALCNTFLDAYECEQIRITVDGEVLSTGHAEYPGYLAKFE